MSITQETKIGAGSRDRNRELVRIRDNHICQLCGKKWKGGRRFDVRHMVDSHTNRRDAKYPADKLITVCHPCNYKNPTTKKRLGKGKVDSDQISTLKRKLEAKWFLSMGFNQRQTAKIIGVPYQSVYKYKKQLCQT